MDRASDVVIHHSGVPPGDGVVLFEASIRVSGRKLVIFGYIMCCKNYSGKTILNPYYGAA